MWDQTRDVVRVDAAACALRRDWSIEEGRRVMSREIEIRGEISPGTTLGEGGEPFALYPFPAPFDVEAPSRAVHVPHVVKIVEVLEDGYVIAENAVDGQTWNDLPLVLTPAAPPRVMSLQERDRRVGGCSASSGSVVPGRRGHRHPAPRAAAHHLGRRPPAG